jgi:AmmeMemoRadiSam system radical SAM enzyme
VPIITPQTKGLNASFALIIATLANSSMAFARIAIATKVLSIRLSMASRVPLISTRVEKKPLLHFHPAISCLSLGTTGCNFSCDNCQNADISQVYPDKISTSKVMPREIVDACIRNGCPAIAYTYNEPVTFFEYTLDTARLAHERDIWNILVSAGYINTEPLKELCQVIDAANIDLKSFSDKIYHEVNHASLRPVLDTLLTLKEAGHLVGNNQSAHPNHQRRHDDDQRDVPLVGR